RPAEVVAAVDGEELLAGVLGALPVVEQRGPVVVELVAAVLGGVELAARRKRQPHGVADAARPVHAVALALVGAAGVEAPEARARLGPHARVLAGRAALAVGHLAGVGQRAQVHERPAAAVERDVFGGVPADGKHGDDGLRLARGRQPTGGQAPAQHAVVGREVEPAVADGDAGAAVGAEALLLVGAAVAVGVAQGQHAARGAAAAERHVHVAVGGDGDVARAALHVGEHGGAEALRQPQPAIVGRAARLLGGGGRR